jgi:hypothetical protein
VSRAPRQLAGALVGLAIAVTSVDASAWCATTTCKVGTDKCETDAHGCARTGAPLHWSALPIVFRFSSQRPASILREEARAAIRSAFHRWSDALCGTEQRRTSLRFEEGEDVAEDKPLVAGGRASEPFGIYFRDRGWPYEGKEDSTLAQTNTLYGKKSGLIEYSDIEINTGASRFSTKEEGPGIDLQAVITHEVGHYIGIAHSDDPSSIMVPSYCDQVENRCEKGKIAARRLSDDDLAAVCTLFPPDGYAGAGATAETAGCSTSSSSSVSVEGTLAWIVAALGGVFVFARRQRRA